MNVVSFLGIPPAEVPGIKHLFSAWCTLVWAELCEIPYGGNFVIRHRMPTRASSLNLQNLFQQAFCQPPSLKGPLSNSIYRRIFWQNGHGFFWRRYVHTRTRQLTNSHPAGHFCAKKPVHWLSLQTMQPFTIASTEADPLRLLFVLTQGASSFSLAAQLKDGTVLKQDRRPSSRSKGHSVKLTLLPASPHNKNKKKNKENRTNKQTKTKKATTAKKTNLKATKPKNNN